MAKLLKVDGAQVVMTVRAEFNFNDTMLDSTGALKDFGLTNIASTAFDMIDVPVNAIVVGGAVTTYTAFDAATYNVSIGDVDSATRYLGATAKQATGRTALVPTGYVTTGKPLRVTVVAADVCTTGKMAVELQYIVKGRANEVS